MAFNKPAVELVNFGDFKNYVAGGGLPEGNYALEFQAQMYQATKQDGSTAGPARLGVMVKATSLTNGATEHNQFYSMGSKAHESFAPNAETGKSLVPVAGGAGSHTFNNQTNWAYLLKSMYDCGLPIGVFTNDLSVLDGVHVHMHHIPEPEDRKGFQQSKVSEVENEPRKTGTIAVVSEILEGGAPWEGGGGVPEKKEEKAPSGKPAVKPTSKVQGKPVAKPAPAPSTPSSLTEEEIVEAATAGVVSVLEKSPEGAFVVAIRTGAFKSVSDGMGDQMAQAVADFLKDDTNLEAVVGSVDYKVNPKIKKVIPA